VQNNLKAQSKHYDKLLLLRAFACIAVIWSHVYGGQFFVLGKEIPFLYPSGFAAVFVFFLLSGYTIGLGFASGKYQITPRSLVKFYINRFIRIAPIYYFALLVCIFYLYREFQFTTEQIVRLFTFTAQQPYIFLRLFPLAILSTEMQFYVVAPLLFIFIKQLCKKMPMWFVGYLVFIIGAIIRFVIFLHGGGELSTYVASIYTTVYGNIDIFLFGMLIAMAVNTNNMKQIFENGVQSVKKFYPMVLLLWFFWANFLAYYMSDVVRYEYVKHQILFLLPPVTSLIIGAYILYIGIQQRSTPVSFSFAKPKEMLTHLFSLRGFLFSLGTLSYGIYIWHYPLLDYLFYRTNADHTFQAALYRFAIGFPLALLCSLATYICIEYPVNSLRLWLKKTGRL